MGEIAWVPTKEQIESTRLYQLMRKNGFSDYDEFHKRSLQDIAWFWGIVEKDLGIEWFSPYVKVLDLSRGTKWPNWFIGGELNVTHNAVDKWMKVPVVKDSTAIIWEGEDGGGCKLSYGELADQVNRLANGLRRQGIQKGDRVALYLPMIPEFVVAMLALSKVGAIAMPVFSGYAADAVSKRLNGAEAKMLITADGFYRRGKVIRMKEEADKAADASPTVRDVVVIRRLNRTVPWSETRDVDWSDLMMDDTYRPARSMKSDDPFLLAYTSGTTGIPKGIVHTHAGFPVKAASDAAYGFDLHRGDVLFWNTDPGWVMGPIVVCSALLNACALVLYEGSLDFPDPGRIWNLVEKYKVSHLGVSPTLVRSLMKFGERWFADKNITSLRVFGSSGEAWNTEPWLWLFERVGSKNVPIFNYSGGTEIGGGILANVLVKPIAPVGFNTSMLGMDADIFGTDGKPVRGKPGELVVKKPWLGMTKGFWRDAKRYESSYWNVWPDVWVHGDWTEMDDDGFWYVTGRSDETLNIAGKRMGPSEMESVLVEHPAVAEAATIGIPDDWKGTAAVCFVVLLPGAAPSGELAAALDELIKERLGKALQPKRIHFVKELPKTRNGKVMRRVIRSAYLELDPGDISSLENHTALAEIAACKSST